MYNIFHLGCFVTQFLVNYSLFIYFKLVFKISNIREGFLTDMIEALQMQSSGKEKKVTFK